VFPSLRAIAPAEWPNESMASRLHQRQRLGGLTGVHGSHERARQRLVLNRTDLREHTTHQRFAGLALGSLSSVSDCRSLSSFDAKR